MQKINIIYTEVIADLSGDLMADDYIVNKLAERNAPLVKKLISRFKGTIKKSATVDSESIKYLKKLVSRFEKALDNAQGGVKISQIGNADDEREEKADSSQQTADSKVDDERKSVSKSEIDAKQIAKYQKELDDWDGKTAGFSFVIGETPKIIAELTIGESKIGNKQIRIDATKIKTILNNHETMSVEVIKELPFLINEPIFILDSLTQNGRIVLLGEVYDEAGLPVMLVLEPNPKTENRNHIYANVIKVASAYGKGKLQSLISRSKIKYKSENKNRVNNWLKVNRLQLPLPNAQYDSATNSITEKSQKDNSFDKNNSKNISDERKSVKRSYEPGGESSKKITLGMSDAERTEILKDTVISVETLKNTYEFDSDIVEGLQNNRKSYVEKTVVKKLRDLGCLKKYETDIVDVAFEFTGKGLNKSMNSQVSDYGGNLEDLTNVVLNLQQLLDTSVLIEIHKDKKADNSNKTRLQKVFVLLSAYKNAKEITPVQFEIKQYIDNQNRLYLAVGLTKIKISNDSDTIIDKKIKISNDSDTIIDKKIETSVMGDTVLNEDGRTRLLPVSDISISQLIEKINPADANFFKYIPDEMLSQKQLVAKKTALAKEAKKYGINFDERKSVKRSYNPFEDIDDEGNKFVEGEDGGTRILFSMPDFDNPAYEYGHIPDEEPDILETYKAVVSSSTEADLRKRLADATKMKVYARKEAKSAFDEIITERGYFEGLNVKFKGKSRTEIEKMLWNALNSADEGARMGPALNIAEAIITNAVVTENYEMTPELEFAYAITGYLKTHFHDLTNF